ncbi:MAG: chloramphenicol acetyltransferase [Candidatus Izemoplasmatales bacterium]|nr:chloramphenicol acetyltransferase [Candidatus Izemoplasmatales bacterium]
MKNIDIYNWKRKKHYVFYQEFDNPCFSLSVNIDITLLIEKIKSNKLKFFPSFLYCLMKAINRVEELRFRTRKDKVVLHEQVNPSYTVLNEQENFVFCYSEYNNDFETFYSQVIKDIKLALKGDNLSDEEGKDDLVYISSVPWIEFTGLTHPFKRDDLPSIPRVTFGKYFEDNQKIKLPFSIQAHHGLVDGLHISHLFKEIDGVIKDF